MALNTSNGRGQITGRSFPWPFQWSRGRRNILHKTSDTKDKLSLTCPPRLENIISWIFHGCINVREHFLLTPYCSALMNIKRDIFLWVKGPFIYSLYCLKAIPDSVLQSCRFSLIYLRPADLSFRPTRTKSFKCWHSCYSMKEVIENRQVSDLFID